MPRVLKRHGRLLYVDGLHLLALCQKLVRQVVAGAPPGSGTAADPYVMTTPAHWVERWRASSREPDKYYKLGGRLILKNTKLYVGDIGPAYLKGTSREDSFAKARTQFLKGTRPTEGPVLPVANFASSEAWLRRNSNDDPTYRSGAQRILDPGLIYEDSAKALEQMGGGRPAPWKDVGHTPAIAKAIRCLMNGQPLPLATSGGRYDRDYSRKQFLLPVFTTAIFHAEPARNERAWPINLMLLDMAEAETHGFTWDAILWHPEAINPAPNKVVRATVMGPSGRPANERNMVQITSTDKLHLVGGLLPASPTAGGERGKPSLYKDPKPLNQYQIQRGEALGPGSLLQIPFDYIHQKEIEVLLKWLVRFPEVASHWSLADGDVFPPQQLVTANEVLTLTRGGDVPTTTGLANIAAKIRGRCGSLAYM